MELRNISKSNWDNIKYKLKEKWEHITEEDLKKIKEQPKHLKEVIKRSGKDHDDAEKESNDFWAETEQNLDDREVRAR